MSTNIADALITEALHAPWCITEAGLTTILAVLSRTSIPPEALERDRGAPLTNDRNADVTIRDGVAIIEASGPMVRRGDFFSRVSAATSYDRVARDLGYALDAQNVRAVLISIDSPGGTVTGVSDLAAMIREGTRRKPIIVHTDGTLASAAYWIAAAATEVVASPTAVIGSIGIVMAMRKERTTPNDRLATFEFVSSQSPKKRVDPETDAGRAQVLATVDALAQVFVETVAQYRGVSPSTVLTRFGQGDVLVGQQALDAGMIDGLGTFEETLARLAGRGGAAAPSRVSRIPGAAARPEDRETSAAAPDAEREARRERLRAGMRRAGVLRESADIHTAAGAASRQERRASPAAPTGATDAASQARLERLRAAGRRSGVFGPTVGAEQNATKVPAPRRVSPPSATDPVSAVERARRRDRLLAAMDRLGIRKEESA